MPLGHHPGRLTNYADSGTGWAKSWGKVVDSGTAAGGWINQFDPVDVEIHIDSRLANIYNRQDWCVYAAHVDITVSATAAIIDNGNDEDEDDNIGDCNDCPGSASALFAK